MFSSHAKLFLQGNYIANFVFHSKSHIFKYLIHFIHSLIHSFTAPLFVHVLFFRFFPHPSNLSRHSSWSRSPPVYLLPLLNPLNCTPLWRLTPFFNSRIAATTCSPVMEVKRTRRGNETLPRLPPTKKLSLTRVKQWYLFFTKTSIPAVGTLEKKQIDKWEAHWFTALVFKSEFS